MDTLYQIKDTEKGREIFDVVEEVIKKDSGEERSIVCEQTEEKLHQIVYSGGNALRSTGYVRVV